MLNGTLDDGCIARHKPQTDPRLRQTAAVRCNININMERALNHQRGRPQPILSVYWQRRLRRTQDIGVRVYRNIYPPHQNIVIIFIVVISLKTALKTWYFSYVRSKIWKEKSYL
jgi:hypothetical protein